MEGRLFQLDCSATFNRASPRGLLYKLKSTVVGAQFLSIVSPFLSDRGPLVRLDGKVRVSVDVVLGVPYSV